MLDYFAVFPEKHNGMRQKNAPEVNCNIFSRNGLMFCDGMSARLQGYVNMQRNVNNCDLCKSLASNSYPVYIMARGIKMH